MSNQSYYTDGLDDPAEDWLQRVVTARDHPEWGSGRVLRWFPAGGGQPPRVRVMFSKIRAPQLLRVTEVDVVSG